MLRTGVLDPRRRPRAGSSAPRPAGCRPDDLDPGPRSCWRRRRAARREGHQVVARRAHAAGVRGRSPSELPTLSERSGPQRVADRDELGLGLGQLGLGVGVRDDAAAGEQPDRRAVEDGRSAGRSPTRRRRWRPSSPPARRSGRGPCPRSRRSAATAVSVGVPPTAADGCRASASWSEETVSASCTTPATSVARCMTLGRCRTNGASGTFIDEQCGSRASATERTAYSCSSRSFDERASVAARARSRVVVAGTPDGAGQHARGHQSALAADEHLRRRAEQAVDVERPAGRVVLGEPAQRPADVEGLVGGGDEVAGQHDLLEVAGADPGDGVGDHAHPLLAVEGAVGEHQALGRERRLGERHRRGRVEGAARHGGQPGPVAAPADDDLGDHQHRAAGLVGEREGAEADQAGAGLVDLVADHGVGGRLGPPLRRVGEPGGARRSGSRRPGPSRPGRRRGAAR